MTVTEASADDVERRDASVVASVRDLKVHFRSKAGVVHAVDGVDFDVRDGETLGLVGETGCGKSVTARSFLGLVPSPPALPLQGSILFRPRSVCTACGGDGCGQCGRSGRTTRTCPTCEGEGCAECAFGGVETVDLLTVDGQRLQELRGDRIAMIFQDPGKALNPSLSIGAQLNEVFLIHRTREVLARAGIDGEASGLGGRLIRRQAALRSRWVENALLAIPPLRSRRDAIRRATDSMAEEALAETQIPGPAAVMKRYPHELSGGMKQRVMIAQALACNPDLLIADEPTTALDVTVQARIMELVQELLVAHRTAVIYISHDLALVRRVSDRIAVMYAGRIAEIGPSDEILGNPQHPYTRGLLAAIPTAGAERGRLEAIEGTVPELIDPKPGCRFASRCPHATEVCRTQDPPTIELGPQHEVACFIHGGAVGHDLAPTFERVR